MKFFHLGYIKKNLFSANEIIFLTGQRKKANKQEELIVKK